MYRRKKRTISLSKVLIYLTIAVDLLAAAVNFANFLHLNKQDYSLLKAADYRNAGLFKKYNCLFKGIECTTHLIIAFLLVKYSGKLTKLLKFDFLFGVLGFSLLFLVIYKPYYFLRERTKVKYPMVDRSESKYLPLPKTPLYILFYSCVCILEFFSLKLFKLNEAKQEDDNILNETVPKKKPKMISRKILFFVLHAVVSFFIVKYAQRLLPRLPDEMEVEELDLEDKENKLLLKQAKKIGSAVNFSISAIYVDGEPNGKPNAFISGIETKYVIITQSLLTNFTNKEIIACIAHEIGHWYNNNLYFHLLKTYSPYFIVSFLILLFNDADLSDVGFDDEQKPVSVVVFFAFLMYHSISCIGIPMKNVLNRQFERDADCFASSFGLPIAKSLTSVLGYTRAPFHSLWAYQLVYKSHPLIDERLESIKHCPKVTWPPEQRKNL